MRAARAHLANRTKAAARQATRAGAKIRGAIRKARVLARVSCRTKIEGGKISRLKIRVGVRASVAIHSRADSRRKVSRTRTVQMMTSLPGRRTNLVRGATSPATPPENLTHRCAGLRANFDRA